ncbi:hypothetical protein Fcan01_22918 [Folsomia candida]|uniref:Uncharacterized protein n=1 Tax=Folsomia candida TaxID=158441 RepID=A0A226DAG6_FOLCA|nr:hypothetical protein Fcan01_22918 [Folsomia candida]
MLPEIHLITRYYWDNSPAYVTQRGSRNVALFSQKDTAFAYFLQIQNAVLRGRYECFLICDIALNYGRFSLVYSMLRVEIGQTINALDRGGFPNLWNRQLMHLARLQAMKFPKLREASPYISMNMLSSFCYTVGITMILLGVLYLAEIMSDEVIREIVWGCLKRFVTFTIIYVCIGFSKFGRCFASNLLRVRKLVVK